MYKTTVAGHPLHPQLILAPGGLLPFSFVCDLLHEATGEQKYADAARIAMWGGLVGGLAAGAAGAVDYYSVPSGTDVKRTANLHAAMNIGILGLYALNLATRRNGQEPGLGAKLMSAVGTAGLLVSSWYGGKLVYDQGMRVKDVDPIAQAPDLRPPGDEQIVAAFERIEQGFPDRGLAAEQVDPPSPS